MSYSEVFINIYLFFFFKKIISHYPFIYPSIYPSSILFIQLLPEVKKQEQLVCSCLQWALEMGWGWCQVFPALVSLKLLSGELPLSFLCQSLIWILIETERPTEGHPLLLLQELSIGNWITPHSTRQI